METSFACDDDEGAEDDEDGPAPDPDPDDEAASTLFLDSLFEEEAPPLELLTSLSENFKRCLKFKFRQK